MEIFPSEIIDNSAEENFRKHTVETEVIYSTTILLILAAIAALPFLFVEVSVHSGGIITSVTERNQLTSPVTGKVKHLYIHENQSVARGEQVAEIASPILQEKLKYNISRREKVKSYLQDLSILINIDSSSTLQSIALATPKYQHSLLQFQHRVQSTTHKIQKVSQSYQREQKLYELEMLSPAQYERAKFKLQASHNKLQLHFKQQLNKWQSEEIMYQDELEQLQTKNEQLKKEQQQYIIRAPVTGTVQNIKGLYEGSFVSQNQKLAEISPDTRLIAECYVSPKSIGLIKEGMKARFKISAFDYNHWGTITGKVEEISNDISIINNQPVFIVRSVLDQTYLELKNGHRGNLRKGMTIQARFYITHRSLFQLLYDNVDDWLNPNWDSPKREDNRSFNK
ncbi:HlyD family secretion protein [Fodinibius sediminis]|uniref:HlyD family secretion protein n=1 Tax=Fodinibius sediminis TaxID=1214077 RepID=A0A521BWB2_9BACT|nr:HlyD family efflux transporter periplasmic adaptor subunit [Fodinibius sediminis]SMO51436.1 HlyD family secretion protein [Fodinibius sediminis]